MQYSRCDAGDGAPAVAFEVELGLERVVDRLDDLPERLEVAVSGPWFLALAGRAQQLDARRRRGRLRTPSRSSSCPPSTSASAWRGNQIWVGARACRAARRVRRPWRRPTRTPRATPTACTPGAGAGPRRSASARRSNRTRPTRPGRNVSPFPATARTRPGSSRPPTHHRWICWYTRPGTRSPPAACRSPHGSACCNPIVLADKETSRADWLSRSGGTGPRR